MRLLACFFWLFGTVLWAQTEPILPDINELPGETMDIPTSINLTDIQKEAANEQPLADDNPSLNFLALNGYFRLHSIFLHRCDLGTFIPNIPGKSGTSHCPPPISYFTTEEIEGNAPANEIIAKNSDRNHTLWSWTMRLRVDPTLNIFENIRIRGRIDAFDNVILGTHSRSRFGLDHPFHALSFSQSGASLADALSIKRLWGEVVLPFGELQFGRIPMHFGLGLVYSEGLNPIHDDGDQVDGIRLSTRALGHVFSLGYSLQYSGPSGRLGGFLGDFDLQKNMPPSPIGTQFSKGALDLDPSDNVHAFYLSLINNQTVEIQQRASREGLPIWNYGILGAYQFQNYDSTTELDTSLNYPSKAYRLDRYRRDAKMGLLSLFGGFAIGKFSIETEIAGLLGNIANLGGLISDNEPNQPVWLLQGGGAMRSSYKLINDRLEIGLDGGFASGDGAPGFGIQPESKKQPSSDDLDGRQWNGGDRHINNFRFHPNYQVDFLLFREILGTVSNAFYFKPHASYAFTENLGLRLDVVSSFAHLAQSTPGKQSPLGLEFDAMGYYKSDSFYTMLRFGYLIPFAGLNHGPSLKSENPTVYDEFGTARTAMTLQLLMGITF